MGLLVDGFRCVECSLDERVESEFPHGNRSAPFKLADWE